jgi:hypothetical protein
MPDIPLMPDIPPLPDIPPMPLMPDIPPMPLMPDIPPMPPMPDMPDMPDMLATAEPADTTQPTIRAACTALEIIFLVIGFSCSGYWGKRIIFADEGPCYDTLS